MKTQWEVYKELELISDVAAEPEVTSQNLSLWLSRLWQALAKAVTEGNEPRVWQTVSRAGDIYWHIYDPKTGCTTHLASEMAVRQWLDSYYGIR